jgi:hypothetical protein
MNLTLIANLVLVVAMVCGAFWFFGRARRVASIVRGETAEEQKALSWSGIAGGTAFTAYGVAAAVTGKADVELVKMEGPHIRIAGALLCVVGVVLAASAFKRR